MMGTANNALTPIITGENVNVNYACNSQNNRIP